MIAVRASSALGGLTNAPDTEKDERGGLYEQDRGKRLVVDRVQRLGTYEPIFTGCADTVRDESRTRRAARILQDFSTPGTFPNHHYVSHTRILMRLVVQTYPVKGPPNVGQALTGMGGMTSQPHLSMDVTTSIP